MQFSMPATATPASLSCSVAGAGGLELADEPGDLAGGDAGADREAADLVDDDGRAAGRVSAGGLHGGVEREAVALLGERDDGRDEVLGAVVVRSEAGHGRPYRDGPSSLGPAKVKKRSRRAETRTRRALPHPLELRFAGRSRGPCGGAKPSSSRARVMSAPVSSTSPVCAVAVANVERAAGDARQRFQRAVDAHAPAAADVEHAAGLQRRPRPRRAWRRRCRPRT